MDQREKRNVRQAQYRQKDKRMRFSGVAGIQYGNNGQSHAHVEEGTNKTKNRNK